MRNTLTLSWTVVQDAVRRKLFYVVFLFGVAILALVPLVPSFEMGIKTQYLRDISLGIDSLFAVVIAVIIAVNQIPGEIEKRTIYNVLSKPVSRTQYLVGKYLGVVLTLAIILAIMGLEVFVVIAWSMKVATPIVFQGVYSIFLESILIGAFCVCLSTFASVPVNVFATILFYVLAHVKSVFLYEKLAEKGGSVIVKAFSGLFYYLIPNLENFNLAEEVGYGGGVSAMELLQLTGYAIVFVVVLLVIGYLAFRKKDL